MDKAVEEMQQELKLLKNEIKETLTDVREHLLSTVENPFSTEQSASAVPAAPTPAAPPVAEVAVPAVDVPVPAAPAIPAAPAAQAPMPAMPAMPSGPMPSMGGGMPSMGGGGPIIIGGGGAPGGASPMSEMGGQMNMGMQGGPGLAPAASRPAPRAADEADEFAAEMEDIEDELAAARVRVANHQGGPGLGPSGGRRRKRGNPAARPGAPATASGGVRPSRKAAGRTVDEAVGYDEEEIEVADEALGDEDVEVRLVSKRAQAAPEADQSVDLVTIATLGPWLERGVRRLGRKRVKSVLEVYASMGGLTTAQRDVLTQLVSLDETETAPQPASIQDVVSHLVELDDLMWRGKQDWRRAALMSMLATNRELLDASA